MSGAERLFLGYPLPEPARREVAAALALAGRPSPPLRLAPPENWHLTLRFLGPTSAERRDEVLRAVRALPLPPAFEVRLSGWGAFPRPAAARVFWVGIEDPDGRLADAAAALEAAARGAGFPGEDRPFRPHVTLGRLREPRDLRPLVAGLPPLHLPLRVDRIVLFRSLLGDGPARYEAVESVPLSTPG